MGQSTHLVGFKPADDKFKSMHRILKECRSLEIDPPKAVKDYFGPFWEEVQDDPGVKVSLDPHRAPQCASPWEDKGGSQWGIEVDLRKLDPDVKILRFYNSI